MPYTVLQKEIEKLDESQQDTIFTVTTSVPPIPFPWGQVCIAARGKVKKLCIEVISSENTTIAVVFYRALEFNK